MKRSKLKRNLKLKNGSEFIKGTAMAIRVEFSKPHIAIVIPDEGDEIRLKSAKLGKYFEGFVDPWKEIDLEDYESAGVSITGKPVEHDGWDEYGMPSVLLSLGLI